MTTSAKTPSNARDAAPAATFSFPRLVLPPVPSFTRAPLTRPVAPAALVTPIAPAPVPVAAPRPTPRPALTPAPRPVAAAAPPPYQLPQLLDPWVAPTSARPARASNYATTSKLPQITLMFWMLKMAATTLGETGGDQISESMHAGYVATFVLFMGIFLVAVIAQVRAGRLVPALFWTVIVATSAAGTEMADFIFKTIGIGYVSGAMALVLPIALIVLLGRFTGGSFSVTDITSRRDEVLYWATILTTNTIGTGVGDGLTAGLGVVGGTIVASTLMGVIVLLYLRTSISRVALFWAAFIMTRPLGATGGDLLWEPPSEGGLGFGRVAVSLLLIGVMVCLVFISTRRLEQARGTAVAAA